MTDSTKTVFEKYQVRKTKKQKSQFIDFVSGRASEMGYDCKIESVGLGARDIVVGDPKSAKVVYTAHYDTCPRLPFPNFITPTRIGLYLLYSLALSLAFFVIPLAIGIATDVICGLLSLGKGFSLPVALAAYVALFVLMLSGPANKNTANDNTSGVTVLLDLMEVLPEGDRENAAFIFFDLEESGLIGSAAYFAKHRENMQDKLVINFDCVSDGEDILFVLQKGASAYSKTIKTAYESNESCRVSVESKGVFYPSDQMCFPSGVGVAALKRSKRGVLYMDKIHTKKDVVYREENIEFLVNGSVKLTQIMSK